MTKKIKSYLVFTSFLYRLVMFLLIPVALTVIGLQFGIPMVAALIPLVEIVSDYRLFGGIQTKEAVKLDFLNTSGNGRAIMKTAISLDIFRKLVSVVVILPICFLLILLTSAEQSSDVVSFGSDTAVSFLCFAAASCWFFSVLGTYMGRFGSQFWFSLLMGYLGTILEVFCWFLPNLLRYALLYAAGFMVLGIWVSILAVKTILKKVEGSYYD